MITRRAFMGILDFSLDFFYGRLKRLVQHEEQRLGGLDLIIRQDDLEFRRESIEMVRKLAEMIIETAKIAWGEDGEALADESLEPEQLSDDPGTQAFIQLYRNARLIIRTADQFTMQ